MLSRISSMIAMALLAMVSITSCSNEDIWDSSTEEAARREYYYNAKFESMFGKIDPNQDWGFGIQGLSRSVDVDGNMWVSPPQVTKDEIIVVWAYLLQKPNIAKFNPNLTRFYLTQVFGSGESYTPLNGDESDAKVGSAQMNHLHVAINADADISDLTFITEENSDTYTAPTGWEHSNNFNASHNANFGGNTVHYDSGTYNFVYANSTDNQYYDDYKVAIGSQIKTWADNVVWSDITSSIINSEVYSVLKVKWVEYDDEHNTSVEYEYTFKEVLEGVAATADRPALEAFNWSTVSTKIKDEISENYYICFDYKCLHPDNKTTFNHIDYSVSY